MRSYGYTYQPDGRFRKNNGGKKRARNLFFLFAVLLLVYIVGSFIFKFFNNNDETIGVIASPVTASVNALNKLVNPGNLESVVKQSLAGTTGTYAVAIKNLKTGESYYYNQDKSFQSASLYKLWVMAMAYKRIKEGALDPDKKYDVKITDLNKAFNIASESAELTEGEFTLDVKNALKQMITISHNYAAMALTRDLKVSKLSQYISEQGFYDSRVKSPPITTASDIEYFYEKLYSGQLGDKESTEEMLSLLKAQQINDRLPKYLPENITVAHKTGELDGYKHDAGIVYTPKGDYIIVLLSDTNNEATAAETEALLSKAVYDYFEAN